jgi:hypothetical protein
MFFYFATKECYSTIRIKALIINVSRGDIEVEKSSSKRVKLGCDECGGNRDIFAKVESTSNRKMWVDLVEVQHADFQEAQEALSPDQAKLLALEVM